MEGLSVEQTRAVLDTDEAMQAISNIIPTLYATAQVTHKKTIWTQEQDSELGWAVVGGFTKLNWRGLQRTRNPEIPDIAGKTKSAVKGRWLAHKESIFVAMGLSLLEYGEAALEFLKTKSTKEGLSEVQMKALLATEKAKHAIEKIMAKTTASSK